ncbi:MAG: iron-containing alcohol dehydrogenase [Nitrolancea sp.]
MFDPFRFRIPSEVQFGNGVARTLGDHVARLGVHAPFIVTDPGVRDAGIVDPLLQTLIDRGITAQIYDQISANPRDHECVAGAEKAREFGADLIVAIGGGSPIDAAKAIAGLVTNGGAVQDWLPPATFDRSPLPLIAIPTTAGTGSEVTRSSVISDEAHHVKVSLRDDQIAPRVALVDPTLTLSLPRSVTAATGMDVLTHAVEAYTCKRATPLSDMCAMTAMHLVRKHLIAAVRDGNDLDAREGMMLASLVAGMAFSNADVGAVHCLAESIGGFYDTPHGVANAVFLPFVFAYNAEADPHRHAAVGAALGVDTSGMSEYEATGEAGAEIKALSATVGIPPFTQFNGVNPDDFDAIAQASVENGSNPSNAREMGKEQYLEILNQAWTD